MPASVPSMRGPGRRWLRADPADVAAWAVPAVVVVFLALSNGGYDQIARSTVGVAVWWTVLVGTALNFLLPAGRVESPFGFTHFSFVSWPSLIFKYLRVHCSV